MKLLKIIPRLLHCLRPLDNWIAFVIFVGIFIMLDNSGKKIADKLEGQKFNNLLVIKRIGTTKDNRALWECLCDCGNTKEVVTKHLKNNHVKSCGCLVSKTAINRVTKHGQAASKTKNTKATPEFSAWQNMKARCYNKKNKFYSGWGGRGITVCERWLNSFENFFADMGKKPSPLHSLDRYPNNDTGNYEPTNCRWGTDEQQTRNTRRNVFYEYKGEKLIIGDWAKRIGRKRGFIQYHLNQGKTFSFIIENHTNIKKADYGTKSAGHIEA